MILVLAALLLASDSSADADRAGWAFKRKVTVSGDASLASLTLPPELSTKAGPHGRSLRLTDASGAEIPYILDGSGEREGLATWQARVQDIRREKESDATTSAVRSQWTIDLGEARSFTELNLDIPDVAFAWHVRLESSSDGRFFKTTQPDAALFDQVWNGARVRRTSISFETPVIARFIRVTARSASDSSMLDLTGASVTLRRRLVSDSWSMNLKATPEAADGPGARVSRYKLDGSSLLPFDQVEVMAGDPAFLRHARLIEVDESSTSHGETLLGEGSIFRLKTEDRIVGGESLAFRARSGSGGTLVLEIENGGSAPLRALVVRLRGSRVRLLFPVSNRSITLYYGNETTRAPLYDLEGMRSRLVQAIGKSAASLGPEETNPSFRREPPLRFPARVGTVVDSQRWQRERKLAPIKEEDVYALTLGAEDLASLRPNLADLRVVDGENRQIPFLVDSDFAEERITLKVEKNPTSTRGVTKFDLSPLAGWSAAHPPKISAVELGISDPFFERGARLVSATTESRRTNAFSFRLARRPPETEALTIDTNLPLGALSLEVDDGDNAPLDLQSAVARIRVPRIVFKAAPGVLRLLLGNASVDLPRYDISGLRSELLAYSAVPLSAGLLADNAGAKPSLNTRLDGASPRVILWVAILAAIAGLIAITIKTLKS
ncbi:MAG: discoidin domain-containing protein [Vicinamibacteria bacterium]